MKSLKRLSLLVLAGALLAGGLPQSGICQVSQLRAVSCAMPCCKTDAKTPPCPMIRPAPPQDMIGDAAVKVSPTLTVSALPGLSSLLAPFNPAAAVYHQPPISRILVYSTPQTLPAPPPFLA